ncbi:MAG TPA: NRAMP family divalent metal transporter [Steroidobacteraceae bacterium]|nr:NRAMP family divalent metal transporter [Steroidobacteraceae bacterium]
MSRPILELLPARAAETGAGLLDDLHQGDIRGALGTIRRGDVAARSGWRSRLATLLAILGPGLIAMVGDNDAGAFGTYTQAGQDYGTVLAWTLLLLVPVLWVNQEMVVRLGVVTRVGHARLILERFGRFWGAFSVIDLFLLNALTIVTEFIGVSLALGYLGLPREVGVVAAAAIIIAAAGTGNFRRFEQVSLMLVFGSLLLLPILVWVHPPVAQVAHDLVTPRLPHGRLSEVLLLVIAIVGTTVAPWQLFFQQSYIIDKRITPRFMRYARADLAIGIVLVVVGALAMIAFAAQAFVGRPEFGHFTDAGAVAAGLGRYVGHAAGVCFALALIDASIIGAMAVSLSTAYAIGDVLALRHSLHRKPGEAKTFYAVYGGLVVIAAALVLAPGTPLGLLTNAVQTLAGVLLPSATVFLLLLCNDRAVLGPHVNGPWLNLLTGVIIAGLIALSMLLTVTVLFPRIGSSVMIAMLAAGALCAAVFGCAALASRRKRAGAFLTGACPDELAPRASREPDPHPWRMAPLSELPAVAMTPLTRCGMILLRAYLMIAAGLVLLRIVQLALSGRV